MTIKKLKINVYQLLKKTINTITIEIIIII